MHPAALVVFSFSAIIFLGTILLMLPAASCSGRTPFIDALFTSSSAVCVTGLTVVDTGTYFTTFGQGVILALIQLGGIGIPAVSVMLFWAIGHSITLRQRLTMQDTFSSSRRGDILHVVKTVIYFTALAEGAGFILLYLHWGRDYPPAHAAYLALFHAISAFCNAGFSLLPDSMIRYSGSPLLNLSLCALIVLGGIGFPVVYDIYQKIKERKLRRTKLSIQTKTVLLTTAILIIFGTGMYWILELNYTLAGKSVTESVLTALFQSITCRTAGFNSVDIASLNDTTLSIMLGLMFFGASPGSCGGGVKTTTLALIATFTWSKISRKKRVNMFNKTIPVETVNRSLSLLLLAAALICAFLFLMLVSDTAAMTPAAVHGERFLSYLFEAVSAFGTVGLSMGVTATLSPLGKFWVILLMLIGRVGVLTFSYIIVGNGAVASREHAEENIMIG